MLQEDRISIANLYTCTVPVLRMRNSVYDGVVDGRSLGDDGRDGVHVGRQQVCVPGGGVGGAGVGGTKTGTRERMVRKRGGTCVFCSIFVFRLRDCVKKVCFYIEVFYIEV